MFYYMNFLIINEGTKGKVSILFFHMQTKQMRDWIFKFLQSYLSYIQTYQKEIFSPLFPFSSSSPFSFLSLVTTKLEKTELEMEFKETIYFELLINEKCSTTKVFTNFSYNSKKKTKKKPNVIKCNWWRKNNIFTYK